MISLLNVVIMTFKFDSIRYDFLDSTKKYFPKNIILRIYMREKAITQFYGHLSW